MKRKLLIAILLSSIALLTLTTLTQAQIINPAIDPTLGADAESAESGATFVSYFITLWRGVVFIGGLLVFVYFMWGGIEWISAGGDSAKVGKARDKITQSIVGLIVLVASFALIGLISQIFFGPSFNLLELTIPQVGEAVDDKIPKGGKISNPK